LRRKDREFNRHEQPDRQQRTTSMPALVAGIHVLNAEQDQSREWPEQV
jgi:hypothetical protein